MQKLKNFFRIIDVNGGWKNCYRVLYVTDDLKWGFKAGEDKYGNTYYENPYYFFLRDRWVIFNKDVHLDYHSRLIPPEWHAWIHHTTDMKPRCDPIISNPHKWQLDRDELPTGTPEAYYPYSTVREKIHVWNSKNINKCS